ncbi:MAG: DUF726 domain-containing protein [Myxococcales bacterium]
MVNAEPSYDRALYFDATVLAFSLRYLSLYFSGEQLLARVALMLGRTAASMGEAHQLAAAGPLEDLCWLLRNTPAAEQILLTHLLLATAAPTYDATHRQGLMRDAEALGVNKSEFERIENDVAARMGLLGYPRLGPPPLRFPPRELEFVQVHGGERLHVVLGVPGFLGIADGFPRTWSALNLLSESALVLAVSWESQALAWLGASLHSAATELTSQGLLRKVTAAATHQTTLRRADTDARLPAWPDAGFSLLNLFDLPWDVVRQRAEKSGRILAQEIMQGTFSRAPISLCGFSLGARVILEALAHLDLYGCHHRIQDVVLLGGAAGVRHPGLYALPRVCSGRVINGYAENDWVLGYLYRARQHERAIGLVPLHRTGVVDVDLTRLVRGHLTYSHKLEPLLRVCLEAAS